MNIYILAKSFSLPQKPQKAILNITADSRYKVFLNGKYIGRGLIVANHIIGIMIL